MGVGGRVHHAVDAVDPRQRLPGRTSGRRRSRSGRASPARPGAIGPVASGFLLGHFWYGSVFLVNVPIIVVALVAGYFLVPKSRDPEQARLDPVGARAVDRRDRRARVRAHRGARQRLGAAPRRSSRSRSPSSCSRCSSLWELHVDEPMLDMHYFRNPAFSTGTGGMILVFLAMYGVMFLITQYFQLVLGYSPLGAALRLLPMAPIMIIVAPLTPRLSARFGAQPRRSAFGMLADRDRASLLFRGLDAAHVVRVRAWSASCPLTTGIALAMSPMTASIMSAVPPRRAGAGSAMNDATRELGAALGIAVLGSVAASRYAQQDRARSSAV